MTIKTPKRSNRTSTLLRKPGFPAAGFMETDFALSYRKRIHESNQKKERNISLEVIL